MSTCKLMSVSERFVLVLGFVDFVLLVSAVLLRFNVVGFITRKQCYDHPVSSMLLFMPNVVVDLLPDFRR